MKTVKVQTIKFIAGLGALLLAGCGGPEEARFPPRDVLPEAAAFYAAHPDFFVFRALDELPAGLAWTSNAHLAEVGSPNAKKGGTLRARLQDFPRTLRTVGPDSNGSFRPLILDDVQMALAHRHPDAFDYFPGLAEAWALDEDARTVYVRLDPAARYSDGVPVTADDFLFMFFFYRSAYILAPWYNNWYGTQYTRITRYDERTFAISIPEAKPDMDARVLELRPVPRHFFRELGDDFVERYQWRFAPTTGAYVIRPEDIKKGRSIALTRLKDWWAGSKKHWRHRYNMDRIHFSVIRDTPKVFEAFKRGDLDQFGLNLAEYWYEKLPDTDPDVAAGYIHKSVFYNQRPRPTYGLWMNTARPLLANRDIRIGIQHATHWQLVIDSFFRGDFSRMRTSSDGYGDFSHPSLEARPFDIDAAEAAFARAGFAERGPDGILVNAEGRRLAFTLSTGYESLKDSLTILKEEARKAGLDFRLEVLDATASWKKVQEKKHDIHFSAFGVSLEMYPRFWETYHSVNAYDQAFLADGSPNPARQPKTQTNNLESLALPEMDRMIDAYRAASSRAEMIRLAHAMTELHHQHASFVPGFVQPFYRVGHWRWVRYPPGFNYKHSAGPGELFVHWIDAAMKEQTLAARREGRTFARQVRVYDQFADLDVQQARQRLESLPSVKGGESAISTGQEAAP